MIYFGYSAAQCSVWSKILSYFHLFKVFSGKEKHNLSAAKLYTNVSYISNNILRNQCYRSKKKLFVYPGTKLQFEKKIYSN